MVLKFVLKWNHTSIHLKLPGSLPVLSFMKPSDSLKFLKYLKWNERWLDSKFFILKKPHTTDQQWRVLQKLNSSPSPALPNWWVYTREKAYAQKWLVPCTNFHLCCGRLTALRSSLPHPPSLCLCLSLLCFVFHTRSKLVALQLQRRDHYILFCCAVSQSVSSCSCWFHDFIKIQINSRSRNSYLTFTAIVGCRRRRSFVMCAIDTCITEVCFYVLLVLGALVLAGIILELVALLQW